MAAQKYVRLKNRNGRIIDWHHELHIIPEDMEVFESDVVPPDEIPDLLEWKIKQVDAKAETVKRRRSTQQTDEPEIV